MRPIRTRSATHPAPALCYPVSYDIRPYIEGAFSILTLPHATLLGSLEHATMRIVWGHTGSITVRQVFKILYGELCRNTVMDITTANLWHDTGAETNHHHRRRDAAQYTTNPAGRHP